MNDKRYPGKMSASSAAQTAKPKQRGRRPTSYDVATLAGVSQSAVSRCFAEGASIAPETRKRIIEVSDQLGYRPNALAQGLGSKRTQIVALLISEFGALFYPEVLSELTRQLYARDIRVLLFPLYEPGDVDEVIEQVLRHRVDGVIAAGGVTDANLSALDANHIPLVLYNRVSLSHSISSVCCEAALGERSLISQLVSAGHRRFGIIAGPQSSYLAEVRRQTAIDALAQNGIDNVPVERGDYTYESGGIALTNLLALGPLDAVICVSDLLAVGAVDCARLDFGLRVPEDISFVGFDGIMSGQWGSYQLTTFVQPVSRMSEAAVQMLIERIDDPLLPPERRLFEAAFVPGMTARIN